MFCFKNKYMHYVRFCFEIKKSIFMSYAIEINI